MTDREKVIKGFDICLEAIDEPYCPNDCPYFSECSKYENRVVFQPLMRDAMELLKAQKPTPVAVDVDAEPYWKATCGGCKEPLSLFAAPIIEVMNFARYCPHCGRPLNWLPHHKEAEK